MNPSDDELALRDAVQYARAILDGSMSPYDGARRIWLDVTTRLSPPPTDLWRALGGFIGGVSEWDDHPEPETRAEIEAGIKRLATTLIAKFDSDQAN